MPDYKSPAAKRRYERSTEVKPREIAYGGYEGGGTKLCGCRGYVLAIFQHGELRQVELHHYPNNGCAPRIETLHLKSWLGTIGGPVRISQQVKDAYGDPDDGVTRTRRPSRERRDRTADGRTRR